MAEDNQDEETFELIIPTKHGYKSAGTRASRNAPPPDKTKSPPGSANEAGPNAESTPPAQPEQPSPQGKPINY